MEWWWLASYPKSGNTWLRMMISATAKPSNYELSINDLLGPSITSNSGYLFDSYSMIDSSLITADEADEIRPGIYAALARDDHSSKTRAHWQKFIKLHDAYTLTRSGEPLTGGAKAAKGAVVIVRDPRAVAPSLAHHGGMTIDRAIEFMNEPTAALNDRKGNYDGYLRQSLGSWSRHVESWLDQKDIPILLLRYEDMIADPAAALSTTLAFAGQTIPAATIARAVGIVDFGRLQEQERQQGFRESSQRNGVNVQFFRRGAATSWRDELTMQQIGRIERDHATTMHRLGYQLLTGA